MIATLLKTPSIHLGIGATILTLQKSFFAAGLLALATIITGRNELRKNNSTPKEDLGSSSIINYIVSKFKMPGFFPWAQSLSYLWTSLSFILSKGYIKAACFICFFIAAAANTRIANLEYKDLERKPLLHEKIFKTIWKSFPDKLKIIFQDPGILFSVGNLSLILYDLNLGEIINDTLIFILFCAGVIFACIAILRGIAGPVFFQKKPKLTGTAMRAAGASELALGLSSILYGNPYTGIATLFFGISNFLFANQVDNNR